MRNESMTLFALLLVTVPSLSFGSEAELKEQIHQLQVQQKQIVENQSRTSSIAPSEASSTTVGGYGEISYNNYSRDTFRNEADLRRFVVFLAHRFDDSLSFFGEMEWEHAIASSGDAGEAAIEQAYIEYKISSKLRLNAGLFLMPFGFLNESHEPPVFHGVERNEVETRIIPSTWREGGLSLRGDTDAGIDWSVGLVTGFDVAKFEDPGAPLASVHQELEFAKAHDLAVYGALNYRIPGLATGIALFTGKSTQGDADFKTNPSGPSFAGIDGQITLGDMHARLQKMGFDVEALYAKGMISNAGEIDARLDAYNTSNGLTPGFTNREFVPSEFAGWLAQVAYKFAVGSTSTLSPFVRYEEYDTQEKMPSGFTSDKANRDKVVTVGLDFHPVSQVVFKADVQSYATNSKSDRFNLGVGYMF